MSPVAVAAPTPFAVAEPFGVELEADGLELSLAELREGEAAVVVWVEAAAGAFSERLSARGLAPGTAITLLRAGDPLVVAAGGSRWGIARPDAARIGVARLAVALGGGR